MNEEEYRKHLVIAALPALISVFPELYRIGNDLATSFRRPISAKKIPVKKRKTKSASFSDYVLSQKNEQSRQPTKGR